MQALESLTESINTPKTMSLIDPDSTKVTNRDLLSNMPSSDQFISGNYSKKRKGTGSTSNTPSLFATGSLASTDQKMIENAMDVLEEASEVDMEETVVEDLGEQEK